jgi:hypothetical protein
MSQKIVLGDMPLDAKSQSFDLQVLFSSRPGGKIFFLKQPHFFETN